MRERNVVLTRCPVVRTEDGPWARWADLSGGAGVMGRVEFRATVLWVRETESSVVVRYADGSEGGEFGATYADYHGYGTSVGEVVGDARRVARLLAACPGSPLTVEARCRVRDAPLLPEPSRGGSGGTGAVPEYVRLPDDWCRPDDPWLAAVSKGGDGWADAPDPVVVDEVAVADVLIWSSAVRDATEEAEAVLDAARTTLVTGLPDDARGRFDDHWSRWRSALWRDVVPREELTA